MTKNITIKPETFIDLIKGSKGATFITFKAETAPKLPKSNPLHGRLTKRSEVNAQINFSYENAVNNRLQVEGKDADFKSSGLKWGDKNHCNSVIEKDGNFYLQVRVLKSLESTYFIDGKFVNKSEIKDNLPERKTCADSQGGEKEIIIRSYKISSIKEVTMNGFNYIIQS
jgi:hypothetical protein